MPWYFEDLGLQSEEVSRGSFLDEKVGFSRLDFQFEPEFAEEFTIGNHRRSFAMAAKRTAEPLFDLGYILDVVDVTMGQYQQLQVYLAGNKPVAGPVGGVEQDMALRRGKQVTVCLEQPAAERRVIHWVFI